MKAQRLTKSLCLLSIFSIAGINMLSAQTDGKPGVDSTPSEMRPPIKRAEEPKPAPPGASAGEAKEVPLDPATTQADRTITKSEGSVADLTTMDILAGSKHLTTFVGAVKAAELDSLFQGEGPYTVFAPTNAAFAALPEGVLQALLKPENKEMLKSILTYHIVMGKAMASDLKPGELKTVQGESITLVAHAEGGITLQDVPIAQKDIAAKNGVIHLIDKVLMPPSMSIDDFKGTADATR